MSSETARSGVECYDTPVLIVGAGPAGLFAACELFRHGVRPRIIERTPFPHRETRGTAIQPAVLEVLDKSGVLGPFLAASLRIHEIELLGPDFKQIGLTKLTGLGCKYEFQCSQPQWFTEVVLRDHLAGQGVHVEFGAEATAIEADNDGVAVTLNKGGRKEIVRAEYLLGAGGSHSLTRRSMQERLDGETYSGRYIVADLKLAFPCPPGRGRVVVGAGGFVLISPLPEGRFLIFVNRDEADRRDGPPSAADLAALLNARIGTDVGLTDLRWVSYFLAQRRVVPTLGEGRRFLLGDAGHLSTPLGGEGINSALMDGADIAWKLALVLRGAAKPLLLETYATERLLAGHHALDVTNEIHETIMHLVAMCTEGEKPSVPVVAPAKALAGLRKRSMLDVSYKGSLLVEAGAEDLEPAPGSRFPGWCDLDGATHHLVVCGGAPRLDDFRARWNALVSVVEWTRASAVARRAGLAEGGLVLVRPDGFIGFRRPLADDKAITALEAHLSTYLQPDFVAAEKVAARVR